MYSKEQVRSATTAEKSSQKPVDDEQEVGKSGSRNDEMVAISYSALVIRVGYIAN